MNIIKCNKGTSEWKQTCILRVPVLSRLVGVNQQCLGVGSPSNIQIQETNNKSGLFVSISFSTSKSSTIHPSVDQIKTSAFFLHVCSCKKHTLSLSVPRSIFFRMFVYLGPHDCTPSLHSCAHIIGTLWQIKSARLPLLSCIPLISFCLHLVQSHINKVQYNSHCFQFKDTRMNE